MLKINVFYKKFILYLVTALVLISFTNFIFHMPSISTNFDRVPIFLLFFILIFIYSIKDELSSIEEIKWKRNETIFFIILFFVFQLIIGYLLNTFFRFDPATTSTNMLILFFYFINFINLISALILFPAVFNFDFSIKFYKKHETRILLNIVIFLAGIVIAFFLYENWRFFSDIVTVAAASVLSSATYTIDIAWGTPIVHYHNFSADIGAPCSGIESMALFIFVFSALVANNYSNIKRLKAIVFFVLGTAGMILVNLLRIIILVWIGGDISRQIALTLFHNDIGWIFYFLYIFVMIKLFLMYVIKKVEAQKEA